ncbi:MAG TPA: hypothetical protein VJX67_22210, partial [Blastocatellia bacterium]|nr:hypothetical protein [Blastocatellia bacterium]
MKLLRALLMGAALFGTAGLSFGQDYHGSRYQDRFNPDADPYRQADDRRAFHQGYEAGYNSGRQSNAGWNHDRDNDRYGHNGGFGGYGNGASIAHQNGLRDGMNDGRKDRATGHSYRPTQDDNYKDAPGYSSSMGDRQQYKDAY